MNSKTILIFLLVITISLVTAGFDLGENEYSIASEYSAGSSISGWINISLDEEPANSKFESNFEDSIELQELLDLDSYVYTCDPENCLSSFATTGNPSEEIQFIMSLNQEKPVGFVLDGIIDEIYSATITIRSDAIESCDNQLKIDIFNDKIIDATNNKIKNRVCAGTRNYSCFNPTALSSDFLLNNNKLYCNRISLSDSPGYNIGAWLIEKQGEGIDKSATMSVYELEGNDRITDCEIDPDDVVSNDGNEVSCEINIESFYGKENTEYYLCVSGAGFYTTGHTANPGCGMYQFAPNNQYPEISAYNLFIEGKKFDDVGNIIIDNEYGNDQTTFAYKIEQYVKSNYGEEMDCTEKCIIPINLISGVNSQTITVKDLEVYYESNLGSPTLDEIYLLSEDTPKISSDFQKLDISLGNFKVPTEIGEHTFQLSLDGDNIIDEEIEIKEIARIQTILPTTTAAEVPTKFTAVFEEEEDDEIDISSFKWEFGNGDSELTTINSVLYTYNKSGTYPLKLTIEDSEGISSSETFDILVKIPIDAVKDSIKTKKSQLTNIILKINSFEPFYKNAIEDVINLTDINVKLTKIELNYDKAINRGKFSNSSSSVVNNSIVLGSSKERY